jgi:hypothetical protein
MSHKETYYELINLIRSKGTKSPKKHGEYIRVPVYDNYSLQLDTWNNSIYVIENNKLIDNLGIDFGGFKCNLTMTKFWLAHLRLCSPKTI